MSQGLKDMFDTRQPLTVLSLQDQRVVPGSAGVAPVRAGQRQPSSQAPAVHGSLRPQHHVRTSTKHSTHSLR